MKGSSFTTNFPSFRLRWEIALALAVKLALVLLIKFAFFSDAPSKDEVATRIAARLAGSGQTPTEFQPQRAAQEMEKP